MRMRWMAVIVMAGAAIMPRVATAADVAGKWVAEISSPTLLEPVYARVTLTNTGDSVSGSWAVTPRRDQ